MKIKQLSQLALTLTFSLGSLLAHADLKDQRSGGLY